MSGHSKWATIKHKKAATDAKRGRIFTKVIREITIAARVGGADPDSNPRLRTAIAAAKNENVREALIKTGVKPESAEIAWVPQNYIKLTGSAAQQMLKLVEALEEHDDVQHVFANFDIDEKEMAVMAAQP